MNLVSFKTIKKSPASFKGFDQTVCFHTGSPSRRQGPATASPAGGGAGQQVQAGVESEKDARECGIPELEHEWCGLGLPRPWPAPTLGTTGVSMCAACPWDPCIPITQAGRFSSYFVVDATSYFF